MMNLWRRHDNNKVGHERSHEFMITARARASQSLSCQLHHLMKSPKQRTLEERFSGWVDPFKLHFVLPSQSLGFSEGLICENTQPCVHRPSGSRARHSNYIRESRLASGGFCIADSMPVAG